MEEDIKILEEYIEWVKKEGIEVCGMEKELLALENLLTRYKQLDSLIGEIDNKEVNDALHMLLHCALKNTEYETQKQQFQIVNAYIKQLEEENKELLEVRISASANNRIMELEEENKSKQKAYDDCYCEYKHYKQFDSIPKSKVKEKIEELNNVNNAEALEDLMNTKNYTITQLVQYVLQELLGKE